MVPEEDRSSCVKPEKVALVWAVLHICLASLSFVFYLHALAMLTTSFRVMSTESAHYEPPPTLHATMVLRIMSSLIGVMFAAFLYYGVDKKKASYVKAYFIYGVVNVVLAVMSTVCYVIYIIMRGDVDVLLLIVVAVFCIIYIFVLIMVRKTYLKFEATGGGRYDHKLIEGQNDCIVEI